MNHLLRFLAASAVFGLAVLASTLSISAASNPAADSATKPSVLTGQAAFTDAAHESPGTRRHLTVADLPEPMPDQSVDNGANVVPRPANAWPIAPKGFKVELYATDLDNPRLIRFAPNGDLFVAESAAGKIAIFRGVDADGKPKQVSDFATDLHQPFGIAFYPLGPNPKYIYIGDTDEIVRFPYNNGDLKATGPMENLTDLPGGGRLRGGGHWTRDLRFSLDGSKLFASVGSHSNVDDPDTHPEEFHRANVLEFTPEGKFVEVYASGIRNCVGEAINPTTGQLWCSTNERDAIGNNLVPDYITHVAGARLLWLALVLYGRANGGHWDPRLVGKHPELKSKVITPDILLEPHFASLEMTFYEGSQFPAEFKGDGFRLRARLVEPQPARGLRSRPPAHARRPRHRRVRRLPHRLHRRRRGWRCLGPSGRRRRRSRWLALRLR